MPASFLVSVYLTWMVKSGPLSSLPSDSDQHWPFFFTLVPSDDIFIRGSRAIMKNEALKIVAGYQVSLIFLMQVFDTLINKMLVCYVRLVLMSLKFHLRNYNTVWMLHGFQ